MRPSQVLRSGDNRPVGKYGHFLNHVTWGDLGSRPQRGIITYSISANRQNPLAGAARDAIFNTWRRTSAQILYWAPPLIGVYYALEWATERNRYLNSKEGRKNSDSA